MVYATCVYVQWGTVDLVIDVFRKVSDMVTELRDCGGLVCMRLHLIGHRGPVGPGRVSSCLFHTMLGLLLLLMLFDPNTQTVKRLKLLNGFGSFKNKNKINK